MRRGKYRLGESNPASKLDQHMVKAIRERDGMVKDIARDYGVSAPLVSLIRHRRIWKHVA